MAGETLATHPLVAFMRDPERTAESLDTHGWEALLRAGRRANLLSRAACMAESLGILEQVPGRVAFHLRSAIRVAESGRLSTVREVRYIEQAMVEADVHCILLKGAAYVIAALDAGRGRLLSDIDIMVPHACLLDAETAFARRGWMTTKLDAYDQRYYRQWMHELPPMRHLVRGTSLDIHHTILPPTARLKPDPLKLWAAARPAAMTSRLKVLAPVDMILHSATHLFHEGEFDNGLRDLFDMHSLIREFSDEAGFWTSLLERAVELDLERPLYYALRYCSGIIGTPVPEDVLRRSEHSMPSGAMRRVMDGLVVRSLGEVLTRHRTVASGVAQVSMYVRSHYLRMPARMLIPHLLRKQFISGR